jgi:diadenosine tetraphosphate (Ap4A) HIT family hydrolase
MPQQSITCPFCNITEERIISSNEHGWIIRDGYPISPGHTLIISRRHVESWFSLSEEEKSNLMNLLTLAQQDLENEFSPNGFNLGINDGQVAGQTIPHVHIHLIPRYHGDLEDPRGGIRNIIPAKAKYWD